MHLEILLILLGAISAAFLQDYLPSTFFGRVTPVHKNYEPLTSVSTTPLNSPLNVSKTCDYSCVSGAKCELVYITRADQILDGIEISVNDLDDVESIKYKNQSWNVAPSIDAHFQYTLRYMDEKDQISEINVNVTVVKSVYRNQKFSVLLDKLTPRQNPKIQIKMTNEYVDDVGEPVSNITLLHHWNWNERNDLTFVNSTLHISMFDENGQRKLYKTMDLLPGDHEKTIFVGEKAESPLTPYQYFVKNPLKFSIKVVEEYCPPYLKKIILFIFFVYTLKEAVCFVWWERTENPDPVHPEVIELQNDINHIISWLEGSESRERAWAQAQNQLAALEPNDNVAL